MKSLAIAFSGPSNSGKTTLIVKITQKLIKNHKIIIIKNDPKDKAKFDMEGKDSYKFSQTGADVVVTSPTRTTYFFKGYQDLEEIIKRVGEFDFLFVEGLKTLPLPRISIFRNEIDESYFPHTNAIAIDESVDLSKYKIPKNIAILNLNDIDEIIEWIIKNAKVVK